MAKPLGTVKTVDHAKLKKIARQIATSKAKVDDVRIAHASLYAEAETQGFHRQALKLALKLKDMEAAKLNDFWGSLEAYCEILDVFAQGDMLDPPPPAEADKPGDAALH
jgi:uncharacterized protein (UPF0335 family)